MQHHSTTHLSDCANLAPAGTGSSSLVALLKKQTETAGRAHHLHSARINHLAGLPHNGASNTHRRHQASCFLLTVRDPVDRLLTAFSWQTLNKGALVAPWSSVVGSARTKLTGINEWLTHFRNISSPLHRGLRDRYMKSLRNLSRGLERDPLTGARRHPTPFYQQANTILGGDHFLVPQVDYLVGLHALARARSVELHVLCTHRLEADWRAVVDLFRSGETNTTLTEWETRSESGSSGHAARNRLNAKRNSSWNVRTSFEVSVEMREFVRACMYPEDVHLHRLICGARA